MKAYFLIFFVGFLAFSALTRCSYVPYHFKTNYVDMSLSDNMPGPQRGFHFGAALLIQLKVMILMTYMSVYESLLLETKPYVTPTIPGIFVLDPQKTSVWAGRTKRYFDWDNDGFAEASAWPESGSQVLFIERQDNQKVDFVRTNSALKWDVLQNLDQNKDGMLTKDDPAFSTLKIWKFGKKYKSNKPDISFFSDSYKSLNLKTLEVVTIDDEDKPIDLVYLLTNKVNSFYARPVKLNPAVYMLPTIRGYGYIPYLHIAMSLDNKLLDKVQTFSKCNISDVFSHPEETDAIMREILFRWAGVDGIDPSSRGPFIDARELAYLEKMMAQDFSQLQKWSNPRPYAAKDLKKAWQIAFKHQSALLIFQTCGRPLFHKDVGYNPRDDKFSIGSGINQQVVSLLIHSQKNLSEQEQNEYKFNLKQFIKALYQPIHLQDQIFMMMQ